MQKLDFLVSWLGGWVVYRTAIPQSYSPCMNELLILRNGVFSRTQYVPCQNTKYVYIFKILATVNSSDNY
jgi:hypothetical protein